MTPEQEEFLAVSSMRAGVIRQVQELLARHHPMTVRQIHYQLVAHYSRENTVGRYKQLLEWMKLSRQQGIIPWEWIEDRLRRPRVANMWSGVPAFGRSMVDWYRRDVWANQERYCEVMLEKDALSGIFEEVLDDCGVTLNVGRGYDSWSALKNMADRLWVYEHQQPTIFCFTDFDPSGEDMVRSMRERLQWFADQPDWYGLNFSIAKVALTLDDMTTHRLPTAPTKRETDTRAERHIQLHGDIAVELDALPPDELERRIRASVESVMDLDALAETRRQEDEERAKIARLLGVIDE